MAYTIVSPFGQKVAEQLAPWLNDDLAMYVDSLGSMFDEVYSLVTEVGSDGDPGFVPTWGKLFDPTLARLQDLGYLGQYVGVSLPAGAGDYDARALVTAEAGQSRGTLSSVLSAVVRSISTKWAPNTPYVAGALVSYNGAYYQATGGATGSWGAASGTWAASTQTWAQAGVAFTSGSTFNPANWTVIDITTQYAVIERTNAAGASDTYSVVVVARPEQLTPQGDSTQLVANVTAVKPAGILLFPVITDGHPWVAAVGAWNGAQAAGVSWAQSDLINP